MYKSSLLGEVAAYESFVHPTMLVHNLPKRVLIFGAGAGASTREVLKHASVEEVVVVGADRSVITATREHLSGLRDCSDLVGSRKDCFDDPRVRIHYENPITWLSNHVSSKGGETPFDIVMIDFL